MEDCKVIDISDEEPIVRRFGEEHEDVAIISACGADVALFFWRWQIMEKESYISIQLPNYRMFRGPVSPVGVRKV